MLGVQGEGEDVPGVEGLVVGGGEGEGRDLVFWEFVSEIEMVRGERWTNWRIPIAPAR